ncbi:MAG: EF-hand domain-containing protein [Pseudomonadota bacterium]
MDRVVTPTLAATALLLLLAGISYEAHSAGDRAEEMFNRADIDADGSITMEEWQVTRDTMFTTMDVNADGYVTIEEAQQVRAERHGDKMIDKFDTDSDGLVSTDEFMSGEFKGLKKFERLDADGDGIVTQAEADEGRHGEKLMDKADLNSDGQVTMDEIMTLRAETFTEIDTDGDGFISANDVSEAYAARKAESDHQGHGKGHRMFERADADGDGQISAEEFANTKPNMFECLDADGDGAITLDEASDRDRHRDCRKDAG